MEIKAIYKIRYWVYKHTKKGLEDVLYKENVVIDNLDYATHLYNKGKNEVETYSFYKNYSGKCQLFIPHIHENGELAYWPDNEEYIEKFEFE